MARKPKSRFCYENGILVFTGKLPPGFDFEVFRDEERLRRDLQVGLGISAEEADLLFPGTQPFRPYNQIPARRRKSLK